MLAPCRPLPARAAFGWLRAGWRDLRRAPVQSFGYGLLMVALSWAITGLALRFGTLGLYLGLLSGFVFLGPVLALLLYSISLRLDRGQSPYLAASLRDARAQLGNTAVFSLVLGVVFLVWARAALMITVFFPTGRSPRLADLAGFLGVGCTVGALFAGIVFAISAFSLPMLIDRRVDTVTAIITSVNAVLRNKPAMLVWALLIAGCVLLGVLTAYAAFVVLLPLLAYATWHGYHEAIDASGWPEP